MKKVLSFVLSVAMVICLMPVMAFAADGTATGLSQFSDADSINNKEAVAVLVGLGVIDGMGDGTFQPAGNLTRAQASKLVAIVVKSGDKTEIPAPAADPFTDVPKDFWAAGAIKFGVDNEYINGMGDGTFHPGDDVTTAQLATMLEKLLGFTVSDVNYNWPENAMAIAKGGQGEVNVNLLEGITKGAGEALSRDDAAQMIFNALTSDDVVKSSTTGGNAVDGTTGYAAVRTNKEGYTGRTDGTEQLVEKYFPKATRKAEFTDDFGRSATKWKNGREDITDEVIEAAEYVYTAKTAEKTLKATLDDYDLSSVDVWETGVENADRRLEVKDIAGYTGNGTLVEIYPNEKDTAIDKIVIIEFTPVTVQSVNAAKEEISLEGCDKITKEDNADLFNVLSSVAADDVVLVAKRGTEVLDAYIPETVQGTVTATTDKEIDKEKIKAYTVAGKSYEEAAEKTDAVETVLKVDPKKEYTAYLDQYGYIKHAKNVEEDTNEQYILVNVVYYQTDKYQGRTYYAKGVLEDGTVVEDLKVSDAENNAIKQTPSAFNLKGTVYKYKETAKGYEFSDSGVTAVTADKANNKIAKNAVQIGGTYVAGSAKMVTVTGKNGGELAATAGSITEVTSGTYWCVANDKSKRITTIFVADPSASSAIKQVIYVSKKTETTALYENTEQKKSMVATEIYYYTDEDDTEAQVMYIDSESAAKVAAGTFYGELTEVGAMEDGTAVYTLATEGTDSTRTGQTITKSNGGTVVNIAQADYDLGSVEVVDLRSEEAIEESGVLAITDVASLIKTVDRDKEPVTVTVDFAFDGKSEDQAKPVKQIYVTQVAKKQVQEAAQEAPVEG